MNYNIGKIWYTKSGVASTMSAQAVNTLELRALQASTKVCTVYQKCWRPLCLNPGVGAKLCDNSWDLTNANRTYLERRWMLSSTLLTVATLFPHLCLSVCVNDNSVEHKRAKWLLLFKTNNILTTFWSCQYRYLTQPTAQKSVSSLKFYPLVIMCT